MNIGNKILMIVLLLSFQGKQLYSQSINWHADSSQQKHMLNVNVGLDYGLVYGVGYGYKLSTDFPIVLMGSVSLPAGENMLDDYKVKLGGSADVFQIGDVHASVNLNGVFRVYNSDYVRLINFGSDFSASIGYYKQKWMVSGEFGFDKAIVTHIKNGPSYLEIYPLAQDGWYEPATGGNFYYGLQTGISLKQSDIYLKAGKVIAQDFKTTPMFPFYAQLGYNFKFN